MIPQIYQMLYEIPGSVGPLAIARSMLACATPTYKIQIDLSLKLSIDKCIKNATLGLN